MKHLIIPDSHAHPDFHNERFKWLGKLIADEKPDHVIMIGDWADMPSLSSYDVGTKGYEGRRYIHDINSGVEAQELMFAPIKKAKKKLPHFWMLEGNHERRITRAINSDAKLEGTISYDDLQFNEHGWETIPYEGGTPGVLHLHGISYSHFFPSGVMGRPIGGVNPAYQLVTKYGHSCTQGHTHTFAFYHRANSMGQIYGCVVGCYQDYRSEWAGVANDMWARGIVIKDNVEKGIYDLRQIRLNVLRREYG